MDKIDEKILLELTRNSRKPISQIAKIARVSRDVAQYRINQLIKKGIIKDFITVIDNEKIGYISALFFVSITSEKEKEFINYINDLDFISWAGTHLGIWNLGMAIYGKSTKDIDKKFQKILKKYEQHITDHKFEFYKSTQFFTEKYFGQNNEITKKKKNIEYKLDKYDKIIMKQLSKNSRITSVELAKNIPMTPVAISQRITKLEKSEFIKKYSIHVNVLKLEKYLFVFFIKNNNLDQRKKLFSYLEHHPKVSMLLDYIGNPFIEFGIFVNNPYETREILKEIKESFQDNKIIDFFLTQEDFISYGVPDCIFE